LRSIWAGAPEIAAQQPEIGGGKLSVWDVRIRSVAGTGISIPAVSIVFRAEKKIERKNHENPRDASIGREMKEKCRTSS